MLRNPKFYLMLIADHILLATRAYEIVDKYKGEIPQLIDVASSIKAIIDMYDQSFKRSASKLITEQVAALDILRDDAWRAFTYYIKSCTYRSDSLVKNLANSILIIIQKDEYKMYHQGYNEQSISLNNIFNSIDSDTELSNAIGTIGAQDVYNELKQAQDNFHVKNVEREEVRSKRDKSQYKEASVMLRNEIDNLGKLITIMNRYDSSPEYNQILAELNVVIDRINTECKARETRKE